MQPKYYGAALPSNNKPAGLGGGGISMGKILMLVGLIAFVIAILVVGLLVIGSVTKGPQDDFIKLTARTSALQDLLDKQRPNIKNGDLKKVNADAIALMITDSAALTDQAKTLFGAGEIPEATKTSESMSATQDTLDKAKLSGTYDRTYISEISTRLAAVDELAGQMKSALSSQGAQGALKKLITDIAAITDELNKVQL